MTKIQGYKLFIWSEDPDELYKFYRDELRLEVSSKLELADDYGYGLKFEDGDNIWIGKHDGVSGKNKDKFRFILNMYTEDVQGWYKKLKGKVEIVEELFVTPPTRDLPDDEKRYCFSFLDPEGNSLQFMTKRI